MSNRSSLLHDREKARRALAEAKRKERRARRKGAAVAVDVVTDGRVEGAPS
jgi:hypothetical protein